MRIPRVVLLAAAVSLAAPAAARADDTADARVHYQKATGHYAVGEYAEAAAEYEAAFKAKQDPALLYNAAQSHRLAGNHERALLLYRNVVKLYPSSKFATDATEKITKLEEIVNASKTARTSPPTEAAQPGSGAPSVPAATTPPAGPPAATVATVPSAPAASDSSTSSPAATLTQTPAGGEPAQSPIYKRWWFWAGVGGVVAVGVVTAIALSSGGEAWSNGPEVHASFGPGGLRW